MKPTIRVFADYCCGLPFWTEDGNVSEDWCKSVGMNPWTILLGEALCLTFDDLDEHFEDPDWKLPDEYVTTYNYLLDRICVRLEREIGDKFEIIKVE